MKKILFLINFFAFALVFSQNREVSYGVSAQLNRSNIYGIHDVSKSRYGLGFSAFMKIPISSRSDSNWYFQPTLEYAFLGERAEPDYGSQKFYNDYLSAYLYLKDYFSLRNGGEDNFFFMFGPKISYCLSQKREGPKVFPTIYEQQEQNFNKFDFGLSVGIGYKISEHTETFLKFDNGFLRVYPDYTYKFTFNSIFGVGINYYLN